MFRLMLVSNNVRCTLPSLRSISAQARPLVDLAVDNEGIATFTMQRPPANSLNLELLTEMSKTLDEVAKNKCKGMILTSALPNVFSAGIDFKEIYKPDLKRFEIYIGSLFDVIEKLFGADFITAAAINGHAPGGAFIISMLSEYRVMVNGSGTLGLNEAAIGVVPPKWATDLIQRNVGVRWTEYIAVTSYMFRADEALKIGLVDEVATDRVEAIDKCKKFINMADKVPRETRIHTKYGLRKHFLTDFNRNRKQYLQDFINMIINSPNNDLLENYVHKLKQKKKAK